MNPRKPLQSLLRLFLPIGCLLLSFVAALSAAEKKPLKITVQLDWVAEPEHGGFYQAEARGFFREEGLDVTLIPGGPGAHVMPSVATGKAEVMARDIGRSLHRIPTLANGHP